MHVCPTTKKVVETRQDSFQVTVADTVGCGDSFAAAVRALCFYIPVQRSVAPASCCTPHSSMCCTLFSICGVLGLYTRIGSNRGNLFSFCGIRVRARLLMLMLPLSRMARKSAAFGMCFRHPGHMPLEWMLLFLDMYLTVLSGSVPRLLPFRVSTRHYEFCRWFWDIYMNGPTS